MSALENYLAASRSVEKTSPRELVPTGLAVAVTSALHVDAAGLSVIHGLRVPIGASDLHATTAERLQITLGEGPCLSAVLAASAVVVSCQDLVDHWPVFGPLFLAQTHFRSVASFPLRIEGRAFGALDLYSTAEHGTTTLNPSDAEAIAQAVSQQLIGSATEVDTNGEIAPAWLAATSAQERMTAWKAIGLLAAAGHEFNNALAILRAAAYARETSLDELAAGLVAGELDLSEILAA
jgi:transcriptional regulator with GAF, ATPase, and Fis domain